MAVSGGLLTYVWQAEPPPAVFASIQRTVARVTHLGRSDALVMAALEPGLAPCRWVVQDNRGTLAMPNCQRMSRCQSASRLAGGGAIASVSARIVWLTLRLCKASAWGSEKATGNPGQQG